MSTSAIGSRNTTANGTTLGTDKYNLQASDFIKMMVTQLQNQDPMEPTKNQDLLAQMSQIGQLQTSTQLQDTLKTVMLQGQLTNAGALIGKSITASDNNGNTFSGTVNSVKVVDGSVTLQLDNGLTTPLTSVTGILGAPGSGQVAA